MEQSKLLSIILLSYYSGERVRVAYNKIKSLLDKENIQFEYIVMDDGSKDDSYAIALELEKNENNVRAYQLSRNYSSNYSWFAGLSVAKGACCFAIVDDEQQPYSTLIDMYRMWENGAKVIIPNRISRDDPWHSKFLSMLYYRIINKLSDISYPEGGADLAFLDREVVDILVERIHPINTAVVPEVFRLGFDPQYLPFQRPIGLNGSKSRWKFKKRVKLAKDVFFSASTFPIRLISWLGIFFSGLAFLGGLFYIYIRLWGNHDYWGEILPGWTFLVVLIMLLGGIQLFCLGMIAEYIWRIYDEVKARPGYIIKKK